MFTAPLAVMLAAPAGPSGRVANPAPVVTSLSPPWVAVGAPAQAVAILGRNFLSTSAVTYNGAPHKVAFANSGRLEIVLQPSELVEEGSYSIVVTNPPPGGGTSEPVPFAVRARSRHSSER